MTGTDKSFTLVHFVKMFETRKKKVLVCCSTGIACNVLCSKNVKARTVHDVFGLYDGRFAL